MRKFSKLFSLLGILFLLGILVGGLFPVHVSAATRNYESSGYDGYLYVNDTVYNTARDSTDGEWVDDQLGTVRVGQDYTDPIYTVYRAALFFDTSSLPDNASISAVSLKLYGQADNEAEAGNKLYVVSGSELGAPLEADHFPVILNEYAKGTRGEFTLSGWATDAYNSISLNAAGIADINTSGYTKFGLLTLTDAEDTDPTTNEWVSFWSQNGPTTTAPYLAITYTVPSLGTPLNFSITEARVYTNYVDEDTEDQLYVFMADVSYASTPEVFASESFYIQLLDEDSTVVYQGTLSQWGYRPASAYLSASGASSLGIEWGGTGSDDYTLKIVDIATGAISTTYSIDDSDDWKGSTDPALKVWCRGMAAKMETRDGEGAGTYVSDDLLTDAAQVIFNNGISGLSQYLPELFENPDVHTTPTDQPDEVSNVDNKWGTNFQTAMTNFSNDFLHVPAAVGTPLMCSFLFILMPLGASIGVLGSTALAGGLGLILAATLLVFFTTQGFIPIMALVVMIVVVVILAVYMFIMKG